MIDWSSLCLSDMWNSSQHFCACQLPTVWIPVRSFQFFVTHGQTKKQIVLFESMAPNSSRPCVLSEILLKIHVTVESRIMQDNGIYIRVFRHQEKLLGYLGDLRLRDATDDDYNLQQQIVGYWRRQRVCAFFDKLSDKSIRCRNKSINRSTNHRQSTSHGIRETICLAGPRRHHASAELPQLKNRSRHRISLWNMNDDNVRTKTERFRPTSRLPIFVITLKSFGAIW